jgi:hypothetical protein
VKIKAVNRHFRSFKAPFPAVQGAVPTVGMNVLGNNEFKKLSFAVSTPLKIVYQNLLEPKKSNGIH